MLGRSRISAYALLMEFAAFRGGGRQTVHASRLMADSRSCLARPAPDTLRTASFDLEVPIN